MAYKFDGYNLAVLGVSGDFDLSVTAESDYVCFADFVLDELVALVFHCVFIFTSYN